MALKTFINGIYTNIASTANPLTTFVNGSKKILTKGITFVNGQKVTLWDANVLQVACINPSDVGISTGWMSNIGTCAFFANKNFLLYSYNNKVYKLDISNLNNVRLVDTLSYGNVVGFSSVDSSVTTSVFYAYDNSGSTTTFNQINVDNQTGNMTVTNAYPCQYLLGMVGTVGYEGDWISANRIGNGVYRALDVRKNGTSSYSYAVTSSSGSISGRTFPGCPNFTKIDSSTFVGRLQEYDANTSTTSYKIGEFTDSSYSGKSGQLQYLDFLTDDDELVCAGEGGFGVYTRNVGGNYTTVAEHSPIDSYHTERLVGKCRGFYYTISCPTNSSSDKKFYLRVFDNNKQLKETVELTDVGQMSAVDGLVITPQLSKTGYLSFYECGSTVSDGSRLIIIQCY